MARPDEDIAAYTRCRDTLTAIRGRRSIRAFLDRPVPRKTVELILEVAARAPSGSNMQPWHVSVLTGEALKELCDRLYRLGLEGEAGSEPYRYYPVTWREPYLSRRRKVGWDLYGALGIARGDKGRMSKQLARNYRFFDAPVGMFFTIDADLEQGSWLDYGMFLQNIMVAARAMGLDTCPQQAFAKYHREIAGMIGVPEDRILICGMALGYADPAAPENAFTTERAPIAEFAQFLGD